jgi:hypothetical protein
MPLAERQFLVDEIAGLAFIDETATRRAHQRCDELVLDSARAGSDG